MSRPGRVRRKLLVLVTVFLVLSAAGLGGLEAWLRSKDLYAPPSWPPVCKRPEFYQYFEPHGYRIFPSRTRTYLYPPDAPRELTVVSNAAGFRDSRELDEPDPRPRILVLGDSFAFGDGVEHGERYDVLLEAAHPEWRVDNLGMTGFGPDLMLMALEEVGLAARPDLVLLCIYTDDFRRVRPYYAGVGYEIPRYTLSGGELRRIAYPKPHLFSGLRVWQMARRGLWKGLRSEWKLVGALLERFHDLSRQHDFELVVVFLPGWDDTPLDRERRFFLRDWCARSGTPFLDVSDEIHAEKGKTFIPHNPHYSVYGHRVLADALKAFLEELDPFGDQ